MFPPVTVMAEGVLVPEPPVTPEMIAAGIVQVDDINGDAGARPEVSGLVVPPSTAPWTRAGRWS